MGAVKRNRETERQIALTFTRRIVDIINALNPPNLSDFIGSQLKIMARFKSHFQLTQKWIYELFWNPLVSLISTTGLNRV